MLAGTPGLRIRLRVLSGVVRRLRGLFTAASLKQAAILGAMQLLAYFFCTISWRSVSQANVPAAILADTALLSLSFWVNRHIAKGANENALIPWLGSTIGGVLGTVAGIRLSLLLLGK